MAGQDFCIASPLGSLPEGSRPLCGPSAAFGAGVGVAPRTPVIRDIVDEAGLDRYRERIRGIVEQHGGRYLFIGGRFEVVEGNWHPTVPIRAEAHRWYVSEEFRELKEARLHALRSDVVFMEGPMEGFR